MSEQSKNSMRIRIGEMDCPTEEALLRKAVGPRSGVCGLRFDLVNRVLTVEHDGADAADIQATVRSVGMTPELLDGDLTADSVADDGTHGADGADVHNGDTRTVSPTAAKGFRSALRRWGPLVLASVIVVAAEAIHRLEIGAPWATPALALTAIAMVGVPTWKKGIIALRHRTLNINALMTVAMTGAVLIGQWAEAAMVIVLFTLAERIEARSLGRARDAIRSLLALAPERARIRRDDGSWVELPAAEVEVESVVRVRPGERIPIDGEIERGQPALDESPITGESIPRDKAPGETVFAGTINLHGEFDYRTTCRAKDTTLARIIHAVEEAQASRAPTQRLVDRFSAIYTPAVFALAVATAIVWPFLFPAASIQTAVLDGVYRALVLLVVACPCALVISTPVTVVSGLSAAARAGILIKGGNYLEQGYALSSIAFDKTGTLTRGQPQLRNWEAIAAGEDADHERFSSLAGALAGRSNHPVSRAVYEGVTAGADMEAGTAAFELSAVRELPGRGVSGTIEGREIWLGNHRLARERGAYSVQLGERLEALEREGMSVVVLGEATTALALFAVSDSIKPDAGSAIRGLHKLGVRTLMLSGDNSATVAAIARDAGIDEAIGQLLPEDKLRIIEERSANGAIGMVGDGINDAPALARADIGFAMGAAGSDASIETADVALMDDDPQKLPAFIRLSRFTRSVLAQNIAFAVGIKVVFVVLAFTGHATLWMAVFADMGPSLLVVANGLRLLSPSRLSKKTPHTQGLT